MVSSSKTLHAFFFFFLFFASQLKTYVDDFDRERTAREKAIVEKAAVEKRNQELNMEVAKLRRQLNEQAQQLVQYQSMQENGTEQVGISANGLGLQRLILSCLNL